AVPFPARAVRGGVPVPWRLWETHVAVVRHLPGTDEIEDHASRHALVRWCAAIADSAAFNSAIIVVIVANAVVLGLETFDGIAERHGGWLNALDRTFLSIFIAEL